MLSLVVATASLALCACSSRSSSEVGERGNTDRVVVSYWEKWSGYEADAMRAIVDDFNRSQDRIEVRFLSVSQVDVKFLLAASSGDPPDLAGLWSFSIPDFAEKNALTPLDEAIAGSAVGADDYIPLFFELCRHRGFTWGLPTTPGCVGLFYNKKLFREAGLDPERPPRTLEELHEMNRRLTLVELEREGRRARVAFADLTAAERDRKRYSIVQVGHLPQNAGMFVSAWGNWFGAEYFDGDRTILANDPGLRAAYEWLREPSVEFGVEQIRLFGAGFGVSQSAQSPFLGGSEAMIVQGPWMKNFIDQYAPGLEWGVAPFPAAAGVADGAPVALVETDVIVIPRGAKHPREAFEFIVYLQRQDVAERLALAQGKFTALRRVTPEFERNHPNPAVPTFIELARSPGARAVPRLAIWREYNEELVVAAERVLNLRAEPAEALAEVQERVQWRLDRVMRRWDAVKERRLEEWREHAHW
ncbi:extracellular solute-binding protein [Congregicoccus parvus]|uniref:ABC transporter substrate-binding protein n=1 Tax=Congregicoccus parvus TaxID=3081749 RepID=UPI003FA5BC8E